MVPYDDADKYLVGGLVIFNLTSLSVMKTIHLDLTQVGHPGIVGKQPHKMCMIVRLSSAKGIFRINIFY